MGHIHDVIDTDIHYKIDGISRTIINVNETKRQLVQYDHNSERLTFEIPRKVDGHDFSECNMVEVHFENVDVFEKNKSSGIYIVDDLHVKEDDEETVVLSWLVSGDATEYVGTLNFIIRFACVTDGYVDYAWNTTVFKGISILSGLYNSDFIAREQYDIIAKLQSDFKDLKENGSDAEMIDYILQTNGINGEEIKLEVGKDIKVGQTLSFKYKKSEGYSISTAYVDGNFKTDMKNQVPENGYGDFVLVVDESVKSYIVEGLYSSFEIQLREQIKDLSTEVNNKQPKGDYALKSELPTIPVKSVNGKTSDVELTAEDVGAEPTGSTDTKMSAHNTNEEAHNDIRLLIEGLTTRLNTLADSDDITLDQASEFVAYIKANRTLIESVTTSKVNVADIIDNLTTNVSNKPLSAAQGVALKKLIDELQTVINNMPTSERFEQLSQEIVDLQNYVTPQMYGAVGDGVADDTQAINDALASGKNVFFPAGTYKVTAPLVVPYAISLSGASGLSTVKTYITDGYVFKSETDNNIESLNIQDIKFQNCNTQDSSIRRAVGNFIYDATALYMRNCRVYNYYDIFYMLHQNSYVINCRFLTVYNRFCHSITDSVVDGNYINASRFALPYKSKGFDASFNSTSFTNNLVDYFYDFFAVTSSASGSITGNMFNRCVNVFHDHMRNMTIVGNMFTGMRCSEVDTSVLTAEQIASLEAEKWCVIKFDNTISTGTHLMSNVIFANNMGYKCDYYFYVADGTQVVPAFCDFRGNQISTGQGNNGDSIVDVGFRSAEATINAYNSMHNVYFDFWDMKEYETLPNAKLVSNSAKSIFSFPYMRAVHNGDIYTNINGVWVKGGGEVELPDLSAYVTEDELNAELTPLRTTVAQQAPLFVTSIEECTDKTKVYVLPDGYVYGYMKTTEEVDITGQPKFTNLFNKCVFKHGYRYSLSNNGYKAVAGSAIVIPVPSEATNVTIRTKGNITRHGSYSVIYAGTSTESFTEEVGNTTGVDADENGVCTYSITKPAGTTYIVFTITEETASAVAGAIITVNEPIEYGSGVETIIKEGFANTGHAFIPANSDVSVTIASIKAALGYTPIGSKSEPWVFTLEDGSTVTKKVVLE